MSFTMPSSQRQPFHPQHSHYGGGQVFQIAPDAWRLEIPTGKAGEYRMAQIDDYSNLPRKGFRWQPPFELSLEARSSSSESIPGTWGFGLWNDPFSLSLGLGGGTRRLPALPNCAWFFFASPENYLSLRDDLPANGALAATFRSLRLSAPLLVAGGLFAPLLALPRLGRPIRRAARRFIRQDAVRLDVDAGSWHLYDLAWRAGATLFMVDGRVIYKSKLSPISPLEIVIWIDNQYAALPPGGGAHYGTLENPTPAWIEVRKVSMTSAA